MPFSDDVFDVVMRQMIGLCRPSTLLDIGPGYGKYGRMVRDIERESGRSIRKTGVEIDRRKVIERFNLNQIYDEVINEDAASLVKSYPMLTGDVAVAGDVIEHMTKSEGIDLIEYLQYRFKYIFLVIPVDYVSLSDEDYDHEAHISIWRRVDVTNFEGGYCIERRSEANIRFLLGSINGIMLPRTEHFVVRDRARTGIPGSAGAPIEFGFLNR